MLNVLDNEQAIKRSQREFEKQFKQFTDERIPVRLGYSGGNFEGTVSWASKLGIWAYQEAGKSRYLNYFGIGKPKKHSMVSITCQINFPPRGIDRKFAGAFTEDNNGVTFVTHRGKIGGGRKDIGKSLFEDNYRGEWVTARDGPKQSRLALIGSLTSPRFCRQVSQFTHEVDRIKALASSGSPKIAPSRLNHAFSKEFSGKKKYTVGAEVEAKCDHGLIVNDLSIVLNRLRLKFGNDRNRDLYVVNASGKLTSLFEIKTDVTSTSLYAGIGQLLLNSVNMAKHPKLILVIPNRLSRILEGNFKSLGIELLVFRWRGDKAVFPKLSSSTL
jgi:hypothetical protein